MIEVFKQFGWKTESGYCFGDFKYDNSVKSNGLPNEINNFTVIPFEKINSKGIKETEVEPICVVHSINHIFILYWIYTGQYPIPSGGQNVRPYA